ncbi:beta/gamma crystallin-related protein [Pleurocapsa sp. PCC 7319]|uniref:beta/gamma crystallin-related protein n=1 Tax=Pleurocapsa sp. PCC 7319 TaxID=118161 RepID=UPI000349CB1F|nr:beta/gamma crystallin-related protein [Pleurocapsa sp. PCC 7319]
MSKINNQSNRLYNINFVQDITPETAANYSGGANFSFDSLAEGEILLYKDPDATGQRLGVSGADIGEVINIGLDSNGNETTFNDTVSSIVVNEGTWRFYTNVGEGDTGVLAPGGYNLGANDDAITSIERIA